MGLIARKKQWVISYIPNLIRDKTMRQIIVGRPVVVLGHPCSSQQDERLVGFYRTAIALCLTGGKD